MVAIPVLIRSGLDERHDKSSGNDEEREKEIRYSRNIYKQQQMEKMAETEGRKWVKRETVKKHMLNYFMSYHLLTYNVGFCCYYSLKFSLPNLNSPAIFKSSNVYCSQNEIVKAGLKMTSVK